ncbi:unnamed protein product [Linum trigynum]|uniref:Uncharacterized protein n=1 Tax=Linum trigynum TaxID=586398 RepID=A0AAV2F942_9ROSI
MHADFLLTIRPAEDLSCLRARIAESLSSSTDGSRRLVRCLMEESFPFTKLAAVVRLLHLIPFNKLAAIVDLFLIRFDVFIDLLTVAVVCWEVGELLASIIPDSPS